MPHSKTPHPIPPHAINGNSQPARRAFGAPEPLQSIKEEALREKLTSENTGPVAGNDVKPRDTAAISEEVSGWVGVWEQG